MSRNMQVGMSKLLIKGDFDKCLEDFRWMAAFKLKFRVFKVGGPMILY